MEQNWDVLQLLRLTRHDWLNRIQVIQGNLQTGNVERATKYITEIINQERQASLLTQLNLKKTTVLLLTWNWKSSPLVVQSEVIGEICDLQKIDDQFYGELENLLLMLENKANPYSAHDVAVTFEMMETKPYMYIDYRGKLDGVESLKEYFENRSKDSKLELIRVDIDEEEMTLQYTVSVNSLE